MEMMLSRYGKMNKGIRIIEDRAEGTNNVCIDRLSSTHLYMFTSIDCVSFD